MHNIKNKERHRDVIISIVVGAFSVGISYLVYISDIKFIGIIWGVLNLLPFGCAYIIGRGNVHDINLTIVLVAIFAQWFLFSLWYLAFKRIGQSDTDKTSRV